MNIKINNQVRPWLATTSKNRTIRVFATDMALAWDAALKKTREDEWLKYVSEEE